MTLEDSTLWLLTETGARLDYEAFTLVNLSFGGMCVRTSARLQKGDERRFMIGLPSPLGSSVAVKARICWESPSGVGKRHLGAEFVESSIGWLGSDENESE